MTERPPRITVPILTAQRDAGIITEAVYEARIAELALKIADEYDPSVDSHFARAGQISKKLENDRKRFNKQETKRQQKIVKRCLKQ